MPREFSSATAEQVLSVVSAVVATQKPTDAQFVAWFCDLPQDPVEKALELAVDLGFLKRRSTKFSTVSPLCKHLRTPVAQEKAAILRVMIESYEPFLTFREGIESSGNADTAAQETKTLLNIDAHREDIKNTLVNLATFSGALTHLGGGRYQRDTKSLGDMFEALADGMANVAEAEHRIREAIGVQASPAVSYENVIVPLTDSLRFALAGEAREAVLNAGNAIESFLNEYAAAQRVSLAGAMGINAKLDRLRNARRLPTKLTFKGKYLGHTRNAADHGVDQEVAAAWRITRSTGQEFVFVACSFIGNLMAYREGLHEV